MEVKDAVKEALNELRQEQEAEWAKRAALTPSPSYEGVKHIAKTEAIRYAQWTAFVVMVWVVALFAIHLFKFHRPELKV